jgi:serine/threonine protein kinase
MITFKQNEHNFDIIAKVGNGGYGTVFKVKNRLDERVYAIKKIKLDSSDFKDDDEETLKVLKECRTLSLLDHPNILRYYGSWISRASSPIHEKISKKSLGSKKHASFAKETHEGQIDRRNTTYGTAFSKNTVCKPAPIECWSQENSDASDDDFDAKPSPLSKRSMMDYDREGTESFMTPDANSLKDGGNVLYIQTEYCDNNLEQYLEERGRLLRTCQKLPNSNGKILRQDLEVHTLLIYEAFSISMQLISALKYLHAKEKLIHRDLKPSNVFLNKKSNADS